MDMAIKVNLSKVILIKYSRFLFDFDLVSKDYWCNLGIWFSKKNRDKELFHWLVDWHRIELYSSKFRARESFFDPSLVYPFPVLSSYLRVDTA